MKHEMLQAFLDAHGVPGPPPPGVFCVVGDRYGGVGIGCTDPDGFGHSLYHNGGQPISPFIRHAPLLDPLALLKRAEDAERERDHLREDLAEQDRQGLDRRLFRRFRRFT